MAELNGSDERLVSWKEISAFLGVDERTCQRWEKRYGLPVRRLEEAAKSRVSSTRSELARWREFNAQNFNSLFDAADFIRVLEEGGSRFEVEPQVTAGDYLHGFLLGTRSALFDNDRETMTITIPTRLTSDPRSVNIVVVNRRRMASVSLSTRAISLPTANLSK